MPSALIFRSKSSISYEKMSQGMYAVSNHSTSSLHVHSKPYHMPSTKQTLEKDVKHAVVLFCAIILTGCATATQDYHSTPPHYRAGDCYRLSIANQSERLGQIQTIKGTQYYISVLANGAGTYSYSDWIPIARLERISTPTHCPSGTPYPLAPDTQAIERKEPEK